MRLIHSINNQICSRLIIKKKKKEKKKKKTATNSLDAELLSSVLSIHLFFRPNDKHQFLQSTSNHPYHYKNCIRSIQTWILNRISSENKGCNEIERCLSEKKLQWKNTIETDFTDSGAFPRQSFWKGKIGIWLKAMTFNITYSLDFQNVRKILKWLYILLTSDQEHKKVLL